jgi:cytochrome c553
MAADEHAACASCHGAKGEGNAQAGFPRLAGLGRLYLEKQLASYADGTRANAVMTPIANALTVQQRAQLASYFAALGTEVATKKSAKMDTPALVVRGDDKRSLQACANCHGPQGIGDAVANPYLAGQGEQYLVNALAAWRDGTRRNDASGQMTAIAKAMTDAEVKAIAAYYAGLPAPGARR